MASNASHSFINNGHASFLQMLPKGDENNNLYLNLHEKSEILSDPTLDYVRRCLLEEDVDENDSSFEQESLRDMEKPFYDILGEKYPPSQDYQLLTKQSTGSPNFTISISKGQEGPCFKESSIQQSNIEILLATEYHRGMEEGMTFLPNLKRLSIDLPMDQRKKFDNNSSEYRPMEETGSGLLDRSRGKKSSNDEDKDISEGQNFKIPLLSCEETIRDEMFDEVLLYHGANHAREEISSLREIMKYKENLCQKNQNQEDLTSLRVLLISCAEAISMNNKDIAGEFIKIIRQQASSTGNGTQRLASILADGLEARLAGAGSTIYRQLVMRRVSTTEFLKAFHLGIRVSPMMRVSFHFANKSILNIAGTTSKIHVIDFGISFGFQWPALIQALAKREGGPPKLRITGVDVPLPGFRPAERVEETGRMLEDYARDFNVPFEYQGIASQWEFICSEDLGINEDDDEVLIINSMYRLSEIRDEPLLGMHSPRNNLLKLILKAKPKVFIHGIFNFSFNPFFIMRFKKVLSHYSKFFDIFDTLVPRDNKPRELIERALYSPSIINQTACEGSDLVVRPEAYWQWHKRTLQIGFEQLPVDPSVVKECNGIVRNGYIKGFFIEEDCNWLLQGWNGSINYAISLWKPQVGV